MPMEVHSLNVDLLKDRASVAIHDAATQTHVNVQLPIETPGNQPENRLNQIAREAARRALQAALEAL